MSIVPINSSPYYLRGLNLDSVRLGLRVRVRDRVSVRAFPKDKEKYLL